MHLHDDRPLLGPVERLVVLVPDVLDVHQLVGLRERVPLLPSEEGLLADAGRPADDQPCDDSRCAEERSLGRGSRPRQPVARHVERSQREAEEDGRAQSARRHVDDRAREREEQEADRDCGKGPAAADERPREDRRKGEERQLEVGIDGDEAARIEGRVGGEPAVRAVVEDAGHGTRVEAVVGAPRPEPGDEADGGDARGRQRDQPRKAQVAVRRDDRGQDRQSGEPEDPPHAERGALHLRPVRAAVHDQGDGHHRDAHSPVRHSPPPAAASARRATGRRRRRAGSGPSECRIA